MRFPHVFIAVALAACSTGIASAQEMTKASPQPSGGAMHSSSMKSSMKNSHMKSGNTSNSMTKSNSMKSSHMTASPKPSAKP